MRIKKAKPRSYVKPLRELLAMASEMGYRVKFVRSCFDSETPMHIAGKTCIDRKIIWVATHDYGVLRSEHEARCILSHEIEHANGKTYATNYPEYGLNCGGVYIPRQYVGAIDMTEALAADQRKLGELLGVTPR